MGNYQAPPRYHVCVLRFWREQGAAPEHAATWRFSLEDPKTGYRHGFANLAALVAFLEGEIAEISPEGARRLKPFGAKKEALKVIGKPKVIKAPGTR